MIKRKLLSLVLAFSMVFCISVTAFADSINTAVPEYNYIHQTFDLTKSYVAESTDTTNQVKSVVSNYFNSEYESIKKGQAVNTDTIICNENLKEYINLRNSREGLWFKKLNNNLINYSININYNSIKFNGNICTIDISKDTQYSFDQAPNIASMEGSANIITLKKITNKWLIDSDVDKFEASESNINVNNSIKESGASDATTNLNKKISNLKEKAKNIDIEVNQYKQFKKNVIQAREKKVASPLSALASRNSFEGHTWDVNYNRMAAVAYARKWANSQNNIYHSYKADCANFVSQSIFAGAPVMNYDSFGWFNGRFVSSTAWINVIDQWKFLTTNKVKGPVAMDNTRKYDIDYGDVIHFWNIKHQMYWHSVIVTKIDDTGNLYYSAHTKPRKDQLLSKAYADGQLDISMQRTAHIFGYNK